MQSIQAESVMMNAEALSELLAAAKKNDEVRLWQAIEDGADPRIPGADGRTALAISVDEGWEDVSRALVDWADVALVDAVELAGERWNDGHPHKMKMAQALWGAGACGWDGEKVTAQWSDLLKLRTQAQRLADEHKAQQEQAWTTRFKQAFYKEDMEGLAQAARAWPAVLWTPMDESGAPLATAAGKGSAKLVEELLALGADPSATNDGGMDALAFALASKSDEANVATMVKMLLDAGADANSPRGLNRLSPLRMAISRDARVGGRVNELGKWFDEKMALATKMEGRLSDASSARGKFTQEVRESFKRATEGLPSAVERGACAKLLLEAGADPFSRCDLGMTAFAWAVKNRAGASAAAMLELAGEDAPRLMSAADRQGVEPWEHLLSNPAQVFNQDKAFKRLLAHTEAARREAPKNWELAPQQRLGLEGWRLEEGSQAGEKAIYSWGLQGAEREKWSRQESSTLQLWNAMRILRSESQIWRSSGLEKVENALNKGADCRSRDACGFTPLMSAVMSGDVELVKMLAPRSHLNDKSPMTAKGEDAFWSTMAGATALELAQIMSSKNVLRKECVQVLEQLEVQDELRSLAQRAKKSRQAMESEAVADPEPAPRSLPALRSASCKPTLATRAPDAAAMMKEALAKQKAELSSREALEKSKAWGEGFGLQEKESWGRQASPSRGDLSEFSKLAGLKAAMRRPTMQTNVASKLLAARLATQKSQAVRPKAWGLDGG